MRGISRSRSTGSRHELFDICIEGPHYNLVSYGMIDEGASASGRGYV